MKNLYHMSVLVNVIGWQCATDPTDDLYKAEALFNEIYQKELLKCVDQNPMHPISIFNSNEVQIDPQLKQEYFELSQKLWQKYLKMKETKQSPDDEYFNMFDDMVEVSQRYMEAAGYTHHTQLTDSRIGSPRQIELIVQRLAYYSMDFLKRKPHNTIQPVASYTMDDVTSLLDNFDEVEYKVSDKNGSFMTPLDKDNARMHIASNKADMFDTMSSVTHELGHALYQTRVLNQNTDIGKIGQCVSLSLHESSSIFHEIALTGIDNKVTKNRNNIKRLGADKIHYILHIWIRMVIEDMLFSGEITAKQIPSVWNELCGQYLDMEPSDDWEGFLQDVHWNSGSFGYFHSYAIGFFNAVNMYTRNKHLLTDDKVYNIEKVILPEIKRFYGDYNEYSYDILSDMYSEESMGTYYDFIMNSFHYCDEGID